MAERQHHALIVEDEALLLDSLAISLRRVTWLRVTKARTAEEALAFARSDPPDVVITDVRMPGMGGLDLIDHLRAFAPALPVVVMTAYGVHLQREALRRGATCFLEKPFRVSELRGVLQTLLVKSATVLPPREALGFEGRIESLSVADVVQVVCLGRQNARIDVRALTGERGVVQVRDGVVVDALLDARFGNDAFYALAILERGTFSVTPADQPVERRVKGPWQELVMEAMRRLDESRAYDPDTAEFSVPPGLRARESVRPSQAPHSFASVAPPAPVRGSERPLASFRPSQPPLPRDSIEFPLGEARRSSTPSASADPRPSWVDTPLPTTPDDALNQVADALRDGAVSMAVALLEAAVRAWPEDRRLRANLSRLERLGARP